MLGCHGGLLVRWVRPIQDCDREKKGQGSRDAKALAEEE
ncbi:hypothetical protein EPIB1_578 [Tritonibacter mobilis]|nr:hypothetical protein SCH4B_1273 [Ruegeria sp. TrichCH4B]VCU57680.1 hypothetical protein EPIB1_578 [Tritonibacter mobilis]